ncbi:MAG: molybdopterin-guanine dinucleotide biosynthesis protein MobB [Pseudomonadota bacterium]
MATVLDQRRSSAIKRAFTTRRVAAEDLQILLGAEDLPGYGFLPGDLALARVDRIGHHTKLERVDGRKARLFEGDEILLALGARYAPDQYEALVPTAFGPCHLAAAGGIAGRIVEIHDRIIRPTELTLLGLFGKSAGRPLNLDDYALRARFEPVAIPTIGIVGTAMNAGKTTCAAALIHGLTRAGYRVGAVKMTGTGAGGDYWYYRDAGAAVTLDFTDAGFGSTYLEDPAEIESAALTLLDEVQAAACDVAIVEVSDGLAQPETEALLNRSSMLALLPRLIFAARESAGAAFGVEWLKRRGFAVACVSGAITRSPLAMRELGRKGPECLSFDRLCEPDVARRIAGLECADAPGGAVEIGMELAS